ncbi:MAG: hypothetical protein WCO56_11980 [Verrucomicrobiota bacterium]
MAAVSETIVREYFELQGFFVRQQRKTRTPLKGDDDDVDLFVINPHPQPSAVSLPFILNSTDLENVSRAMVVIRAWHTETFSPSLLANTPEIFRNLGPATFQLATKAFGIDGEVTKILVVPALPAAHEARQQSIEMLKAKGIDAIIPFRTILSNLIAHIEVNRNYQKSDVLQVMRILKNYEFIKEPQLELFKILPRRPVGRPPKKNPVRELTPEPKID